MSSKAKSAASDTSTKSKKTFLASNEKSSHHLYDELKAADCVICGGSGRSLYAINAALSQIALSQAGWRNKVVLTPDDPGFPGKSMYDAAADLERRYKKTLLLINSGSGYSDDPLSYGSGSGKYIEEKKTSRFSMGLLTSAVRLAVGGNRWQIWQCG